MILKDVLDPYIASAMRNKEDNKLKVLRLIKSEYQKFETSGNGRVLDEVNEVKILKKLHKQWKEELEAFIEAGRETFALTFEIKYLESFIPKEKSEEEQREDARKIIEKYMNTIPVENRKSMQHLGAIMKIVNKETPMLNGKLVSEVYREVIGM